MSTTDKVLQRAAAREDQKLTDSEFERLQRNKRIIREATRGTDTAIIARIFGLSVGTVNGVIRDALAERSRQLAEQAEGLHAQYWDDLDLAKEAIRDRVEDGDLPAVDRWLAILAARMKLTGVPDITVHRLEKDEGQGEYSGLLATRIAALREKDNPPALVIDVPPVSAEDPPVQPIVAAEVEADEQRNVVRGEAWPSEDPEGAP